MLKEQAHPHLVQASGQHLGWDLLSALADLEGFSSTQFPEGRGGERGVGQGGAGRGGGQL